MVSGTFPLFAVALVLAASGACAQSYPSHPIRLIHGFAAGGQGDTIARVLAQEMPKGLGQPIVVESKPGADGNIASESVARAQPDGYILLLATGAVPVSAAIHKSLPFKPVDDFEWISTAMLFSFVISSRNDGKIQSLPDLLQAAKAAPNAVSFGTGGIGARLAGEMLASIAHVKPLHVAYKGDAPALVGILGGDTDFVVTPATIAVPYIKSGKLKALAITGATRWPGLPDVPTVAEQGFAGFDVRSWIGLAARAGTPRPIVDRLRSELLRTIQVPEVRTKLEGFGFEVQGSTPEDMRSRVASEIKQWQKIIVEAGIEQQ
jgi:tripartite-type tricarboxylate transporter receptor subunit TctC